MEHVQSVQRIFRKYYANLDNSMNLFIGRGWGSLCACVHMPGEEPETIIIGVATNYGL